MANAGRRTGTTASLQAPITAFTRAAPAVSAIFVAELDAYFASRCVDMQGWLVWRHYLGEGSVSMAWLVHPGLAGHAQRVTWDSRAGLLEFTAPHVGEARYRSHAVIGTHGSHSSDLLYDDFAAVARLAHKRSRAAQLHIVGDWNVDMLPATAFADGDHAYQQKHNAERAMLSDLATALGMKTILPTATRSFAGGPWLAEQCFRPVTRIPEGEQASWPSCLDYMLAPHGSEAVAEIHWEGAPADRHRDGLHP